MFGDVRYEGLATVSVAHLYNLRQRAGYQRHRQVWTKPRPVTIPSANDARRPATTNRATCAWTASKASYHINTVDCVNPVRRGGHLKLHPDKPHVGDCRIAGEGFEFLGYQFQAGQRWVRQKSLKALRDKIRNKTKRTCGDSLASVVASLNPILKGWLGYFRHAHHYTFSTIDGFVRRRLRAVMRRRLHRPGQGHNPRDHKPWPNAFFADLGLFAMYEALRSARQSRCGNN